MRLFFFILLAFYIYYSRTDFFQVVATKSSSTQQSLNELEQIYAKFLAFYKKMKDKIKDEKRRGIRLTIATALPLGKVDTVLRFTGQKTIRERLWGV